MAKKSSIEKNNRRKMLAAKYAAKRDSIKSSIKNSKDPKEVFALSMKLTKLPRNSMPCRVRNRCDLTGRPRGYYRRFRMSRVSFRELASIGAITGVVKSSW